MSNIIQTFPKGGSPTYAGLQDKPTVNDIDIETLSIEGMDVIDNSGTTEISASGLNADSMADVLSGDIANYAVTSGNTYSTSEQIVGKWIDGKPIYQKTLTCALGNATTVNTPHNISNLDSVINIFGYGKDASGNSFPVPYAPVGNVSWGVQVYVSLINVICVTAQNWSGSTIKVTLQYTKTTDT